jgi:NAD(P)H-hydrate epimerase
MHHALPLYATAAVRAIDAAAIAGGIPGYRLMCRAAAAALETLLQRWPQARRLLLACGPGNNGGDGLVLARIAREGGFEVRVLTLDMTQARGVEARQAMADWRAAGGEVDVFDPQVPLPPAEIIVDALFGIGLTRAPGGLAVKFIDAINLAGCPVLALDVPSGVNADSGAVPGVAVRADLTLSFIVAKRGLFTGPALDVVGVRELAALDVPESAFAGVPPAAWALDGRALAALPVRRANGHKGDHGHVLVVGGDHGAGGALRLCAEAALRSGAGLVTALTREAHVSALLTARPECMARGTEGELPDACSRASVIALGPGLGQSDWGRSLYAALIDDPRPLVLDADALNLLAASPRPLRSGRVLTPHPGEAARLLGVSTVQVQSDRHAALDALVARYTSVVVLKGAGTLVGAPGEATVSIAAGNPGMGSGGMGDLLTGVIAALLAQGMTPLDAARLGALLHAVAGDQVAVREGQRGMLALDLLPWLRGDCAYRQALATIAEIRA